MTRRFAALLACWVLAAYGLRAQPTMLRGEVVLVDENGMPSPAARVEVTIRETGGSDIADGKGLFRIALPKGFQLGREITVSADKPGWAIWQPTEGKTPIPQHLLTIRLLPKGSKKFWTDKFIQTFIEDAVEKAKLQVRLTNQQEPRKPVDFGPMIKEWALKYGFSPEDAKKQIDKWIADVQAAQQDIYKLGLAAFAEHNFRKAGELFDEAGRNSEKQLAAVIKQETELDAKRARLIAETVRNYRQAGDARYSDYAFGEALAAYQKALGFVDRARQPELWAEVKVEIGNASREIGERAQGSAVHQYLAEAMSAYNAALEVLTRERWPRQWAYTQNNLGIALRNQGTRAEGKEARQLLEQAEIAYRAVLEVWTRKQWPQEWAKTQNNLALVLWDQGTRADGAEGRELLKQAVSTLRACFEVYTREQWPQNWATTQNNLGDVLVAQGIRTSGEECRRLLVQAVFAFRAALEVRTREEFPQDWAATQNNFANALREQATRTRGEGELHLLAQAVVIFHAVLEVYTREQLPQQWAAAQDNLGAVLAIQGRLTGGERGRRLLAQAVSAFGSALQVRTREELPQYWAATQNDLANALGDLGTMTGGELGRHLLAQAVAAYRAALEVYTREQLPQAWASTQNNLGIVLHDQAVVSGEDEARQLLAQSVTAFQRALEVRTPDNFPVQWAETHTNLLATYYVQWNAAQSSFTMGRFVDAESRLAEILGNVDLNATSRISLHALEIAALLAQHKSDRIPSKLQALNDLVLAQPASFRGGANWTGIVHFVQTDDRLAPVRAWLLLLFEAIQGKDRATILEGLSAATSGLAMLPK